MSVPNQKTLTIIKREPTPPFLQINEDDWQTAYKKLSPSAFGIYLYLAQNANGYKFEFSPTAIANTGLMSKGTATKARQELESIGYIVDGYFYTEYIDTRARREKIKKEIEETIEKREG